MLTLKQGIEGYSYLLGDAENSGKEAKQYRQVGAADEERTFTPAVKQGVVGLYPQSSYRKSTRQASGGVSWGFRHHTPQRVSGLGLLRVFIPHY